MKPTPTATDRLKPEKYSSQIPPIGAKRIVPNMTIRVSPARRKCAYRRSMITASVSGTTTMSLRFARSMYSYCPDQTMETPVGSLTSCSTARRALRT
jgi:hypothetical protein